MLKEKFHLLFGSWLAFCIVCTLSLWSAPKDNVQRKPVTPSQPTIDNSHALPTALATAQVIGLSAGPNVVNVLAIPQPPLSPINQQALVAASVFRAEPVEAISMIRLGYEYGFLPQPAAVQEVATGPLEARPLDLSSWFIEDGVEIPNFGSRGRRPELTAYTYVLNLASRASVPSFKAHADTTITYGHMYRFPAEYRGKIVRLHGALVRLRKWDKLPDALVKLAGVKELYEGWTFDPRAYGVNPTWIVFTELPEGLEPSEKMYQQIVFYGYFFKLARYKSAEVRNGKPVYHVVPLLVGRSPILIKQSGTASTGIEMMTLFLGLLAGTFLFALIIWLWYRRDDQRIRKRLILSSDEAIENIEAGNVPPMRETFREPSGFRTEDEDDWEQPQRT
ncbi:MAG: hypothetical protein KatS3mg105_0924 [Gemmatales bacterium]|nr:MAG: hypothetical protein KatS3mg105_0924 [Gemmatales bacterium]